VLLQVLLLRESSGGLGPSRPSSGRTLLGPNRDGAVRTAALAKALVETLVEALVETLDETLVVGCLVVTVTVDLALSATVLFGTDVFVALEFGQTSLGVNLIGRHAHPITGVFGPIPVLVVAIANTTVETTTIALTLAHTASEFALAWGGRKFSGRPRCTTCGALGSITIVNRLQRRQKLRYRGIYPR